MNTERALRTLTTTSILSLFSHCACYSTRADYQKLAYTAWIGLQLCFQNPSQGPLLPVPWSERESLENAGHVSPRIWEMTRHNLEGKAGKSGVMVRICSSSLYVMFCHLPDAWGHVTSVFQGLSLSLAPGDGKERTLGKRLPRFCSFCLAFLTHSSSSRKPWVSTHPYKRGGHAQRNYSCNDLWTS